MIIQFNNSLTNIINDIKCNGYEQFINTLKQKYGSNNLMMIKEENNDETKLEQLKAIPSSKDIKKEMNKNRTKSIDKRDDNINLVEKNMLYNIDLEELKNLSSENIKAFIKQKNIKENIIQYKELNNLISILIDFEIIKRKMKKPLNLQNSHFEKYYLINYEWIKKYLELNNMVEIYNYLVKEKIVENIINDTNIIRRDKIIKEVFSKIDINLITNIHKNNQLYTLKDNQLSDISKSYFIKENDKYIIFYHNFIILSEETINSLFDLFCFNIKKSNSYLILFGDNKIFIDLINANQYTLEIGDLDNNYNFAPNLFLDYSNQQYFDYGKYLLKKNGYKPFIQDYMFLKNDYFSPIFYIDNNIIGNAYKYESSIKDYREYNINNHLKNIIILYLNQFLLKAKFKENEIKQIKFYLINNKYIEEYKNFFDYSILENQLKQNVIITQTVKAFENNSNKEENLINDKKIILIIKYLPLEINSNYNINEALMVYFIIMIFP